MIRARFLVVIVSLVFAGCDTTGGASMYPDAIQSGTVIKANTAVVLVGNGGDETINYLQFVHSSLPAINAREIRLQPGGIAAIPVPVGTTALSLSNFTTAGKPGGYLSNGMAFGYVPVRTPPIDINAPGLYYVATIFPGRQPNFDSKPIGSLAAKLKSERPELSGLKPMNFGGTN